eukprot:TRINITY_DN8516_c1_g4_i1.p1 TRINITY_DN8516_c1_g4~~TRINITY_DN8516_c1_g4_i1.p1  ORF type:complete len:254 (+),score=95.73 TRINITY_DN8516_c1_g4_i1:125-886(+)
MQRVILLVPVAMAFTPEEFRTLLPDQVKGLAGCERMTGAQLANIDPERVVNMQPGCVGALPAATFASFSAEQLAELTAPALGAVTAEQLAALPPVRCAQFAMQDNFEHMPLGVCSGFSAECVSRMRQQDIERYFTRTPQCQSLLSAAAKEAIAAGSRSLANVKPQAKAIPAGTPAAADESAADKMDMARARAALPKADRHPDTRETGADSARAYSHSRLTVTVVAAAAALAGVAGYGLARIRRRSPEQYDYIA